MFSTFPFLRNGQRSLVGAHLVCIYPAYARLKRSRITRRSGNNCGIKPRRCYRDMVKQCGNKKPIISRKLPPVTHSRENHQLKSFFGYRCWQDRRKEKKRVGQRPYRNDKIMKMIWRLPPYHGNISIPLCSVFEVQPETGLLYKIKKYYNKNLRRTECCQ